MGNCYYCMPNDITTYRTIRCLYAPEAALSFLDIMPTYDPVSCIILSANMPRCF